MWIMIRLLEVGNVDHDPTFRIYVDHNPNFIIDADHYPTFLLGKDSSAGGGIFGPHNFSCN